MSEQNQVVGHHHSTKLEWATQHRQANGVDEMDVVHHDDFGEGMNQDQSDAAQDYHHEEKMNEKPYRFWKEYLQLNN